MNVSQHANQRPQNRTQRVTIYPTLVSQKKFWIQLYNIEQCVFTVHLYELSGQQVYKHFIFHSNLHSNHTIYLPTHIGRGIYKLAVRYGDNHIVQPMVID